jgi:hypothetical protein
MTSDQYLELLLAKYTVSNGNASPAHQAAATIIPPLKEWAGAHLLEIAYSGSYAKGTAISLGTDVDLFLSLDHDCGPTVKEIFWSLHAFLDARQFHPQPRNVAISINFGGLSLDLVPGRRQHNSADHTLYRRRADTWMQTNVAHHIQLIAESGRTAEIRLAKIWRQRHHLDFPSFYLELTVLEALKCSARNQLAENFRSLLRYLAEDFTEAAITDPANSNNQVSEDLSQSEKRAIATQARTALSMHRWEHILW